MRSRGFLFLGGRGFDLLGLERDMGKGMQSGWFRSQNGNDRVIDCEPSLGYLRLPLIAISIGVIVNHAHLHVINTNQIKLRW